MAEEERDERRECSICGRGEDETSEIELRLDPLNDYADPEWVCEQCFYRRSQGEIWRPGDEW